MLGENKLLKRSVKYFTYLLLLLLVISIPSILYLGNFWRVVFDEDIYKAGFEKYDVYEKFPDQDVDRINTQLLNYFKYEEKNVPIAVDFFNEKEKKHLIDVKLIIRLALFALYSNSLAFAIKFLLLILLVRYRKEDILNYTAFLFVAGGLLTIIPTLALAILMKIKFDLVFTTFHLITFKNDLWLLNPATDNLLSMYPEGFFYTMAMKIVLATLIQAAFLIIIGLSVYRLRKRFKNKGGIKQ